MNIPVVKFTVSKKEIPLILLSVVRCPDGIYGICVGREPKTIQDRTLQVTPIQSLIIPEEYYPELLSYGVTSKDFDYRLNNIEDSLKDIKATLSTIKTQMPPKTSKTTKKVLTEDTKSGK